MSTEPSYMSIYRDRFGDLKDIAHSLRSHLEDILSGMPRIDSINARPKDPNRFFAKAVKKEADGSAKYIDPLNEIQDQVGGRVTTFYLGDVEAVRTRVLKYLRPIEIQEKSPITDNEFGYFGLHFILRLPDDVMPASPKSYDLPEFFELQVKTLFQHAWSEAHHDLGYKSFRDLTSPEKRKVAFTAAQAWGADTIFDELSRDLVSNDNVTPITT